MLEYSIQINNVEIKHQTQQITLSGGPMGGGRGMGNTVNNTEFPTYVHNFLFYFDAFRPKTRPSSEYVHC
jgi:hypothetical protein